MSKKEPAKMIEDLLKAIDADLDIAEKDLSNDYKNRARNNIAKARGRIGNFLMIMEYL
ncbi:MAG: hypothetical protein Q4F83_11060 [Eubacteriales bacterium]|nr:hypothetical protein [Eubacteriales bacterium]